MATTGLSTSMLTDAAMRGRAYRAFRIMEERQTPRWKSCGIEEINTGGEAYVEFSSFTGVGSAQPKEEFAQIAMDTPKQNYEKRVSVKPHALGIPISEEMDRYIKKGSNKDLRKLLNLSEMLSNALTTAKETRAADLFGNAFSTDYTHPDGQPLVSTSHKMGRGGTYSNHLGAVSISQESLEAAIIQGKKMPDDVGFPVGVPDGEKILISQEDVSFDIERILESTLQSDTANNAKNTLKGKGIKPFANTYLPSTSNWFIRNTGVKNSLVYVVETESEMRDFTDDKTRTKYFTAYMNNEFDFFEPRGVQGSNI